MRSLSIIFESIQIRFLLDSVWRGVTHLIRFCRAKWAPTLHFHYAVEINHFEKLKIELQEKLKYITTIVKKMSDKKNRLTSQKTFQLTF